MAGRRVGARWWVLGATLLAVLTWFVFPMVFRQVGFFTVRRIELVGARHLSSAMILDVLALRHDANVFDDYGQAEQRIRDIPGITSARIARRLPGTLRVQVNESRPVALVPKGDKLELLDAAARVLPFDPATSAPDLPVVLKADSVVTGVLALVHEVDRDLFGRISHAARERGDVVFDLGTWRLRLSQGATPEVVDAVLAVERELERRRWSFRELDARFAGQVVVRGRAA